MVNQVESYYCNLSIQNKIYFRSASSTHNTGIFLVFLGQDTILFYKNNY